MTTSKVFPRWLKLLPGIILLGSLFALPVGAQMTIPVNSGGTITSGDPFFSQSFTFTVPNGTGNIADLNVRLAIQYPALGELTILLTSPHGTELDLLDNLSGANLKDTVLDDSGVGRIGVSGSAPFAGPAWSGSAYQPQYFSLSNPNSRLFIFNNENPQGDWTLTVKAYQLSPPTLNGGQLFAAGGAAPWGTAIGTALILTPVPEPQQYSIVFGCVLALGAAVRRILS